MRGGNDMRSFLFEFFVPRIERGSKPRYSLNV